MKEFIRQRLLEAIKSSHWKQDSYPTRIIDSTFSELGPKAKAEVDSRINFIESLEFSEEQPQKIGVWIYTSPKIIKHPPFQERDKGSYLLGIINNNNMTTLYWKHKKEGQYDFDITYEELVEFAKSEYYDANTKKITIKAIKDWFKSKNKPEITSPNVNKFRKIKLNNGTIIKYYDLLNKFETIDNQPIAVDSIFNELPSEIQDKVFNLLEGR
jgi:hypothetical protein